MEIRFDKYQGTGNDFILVDDRSNSFPTDTKLIKHLCDRRFGIGADGLMLLQNIQGYDFRMVYFNSDGNESSMCGNGGRCIVAFAKKQKVISDKCNFLAIDGPHAAEIDEASNVKLKMNDVNAIESHEDAFYLNTGSPHYVKLVQNIDSYPVFEEGKRIRHHENYQPKGTNVNFLQVRNGEVVIRTFERGVEDETFSCGTGVTAGAIVASLADHNISSPCKLKTLGGDLYVHYNRINDRFSDIWLEGPATYVFSGQIRI